MSIEDLRGRQRQTLEKAGHSTLWLKLSEEMSMQQDHFHQLQALHGKYCHGTVATLPDGWTDIIGKFLAAMDHLGDLVDAVSLRFERTPDGARAFAFPEMSRWHPEQMNSLRIAQRDLLHASRETCERCGKCNAAPVSVGERALFLCQEHTAEVERKLASLAEAMDERARFRESVSDILPPTTALLLPMTEYNTAIMRKALLDIKAIVDANALTGHVIATKIIESEGQLFIGVRCGPQVDPASQFEIADIVKQAEWESDQAHLAAGKEGFSDDA
ncbi:hypothetical protein [Agrobacterium tumefaciens]|uniref:Uncharacterized protein n=1 Tax=Agrobacterium tumefaciens TaxID=358 RepID=A0A176XDQ2_AGRTU|nr:hypothetical protein [Agrobacterium tumefaciens]OAE46833.1 hypothetical protein A7J57_12160 [Agrobacterium tumefaciens]